MFQPALNILLWSPTYRKEKRNYFYFRFYRVNTQGENENSRIPINGRGVFKKKKIRKNAIETSKNEYFLTLFEIAVT